MTGITSGTEMNFVQLYTQEIAEGMYYKAPSGEKR